MSPLREDMLELSDRLYRAMPKMLQQAIINIMKQIKNNLSKEIEILSKEIEDIKNKLEF